MEIPKHKRPVTKHWNWLGVAIFLFYCAATVYYFVIRATRTLNMGYLGYGVVVLLIEIISSTATFGYAILLIKYSKSRRTKGLPIPRKGEQPDLDNLRFHVRVLIPCYKESCELVKLTVLGALKAPLPKDTIRTVYLCDDGKDPTKEEMVRELNMEWGCLEYVSGRKRDPNGALAAPLCCAAASPYYLNHNYYQHMTAPLQLSCSYYCYYPLTHSPFVLLFLPTTHCHKHPDLQQWSCMSRLRALPHHSLHSVPAPLLLLTAVMSMSPFPARRDQRQVQQPEQLPSERHLQGLLPDECSRPQDPSV